LRLPFRTFFLESITPGANGLVSKPKFFLEEKTGLPASGGDALSVYLAIVVAGIFCLSSSALHLYLFPNHFKHFSTNKLFTNESQ